MRLTPLQVERLRTVARRHFGRDARVWIFGSRVRDDVRGGDFDVYLECSFDDPDRIVDARLRMLADLHAMPEFEDERIDLVVRRPGQSALVIHELARREGVEL